MQRGAATGSSCPSADNLNTNWPEHVREQSNPPVAPVGDSTLATAVLALTLGPALDRDEDGWADANNDKDFLDLNNSGTRDAGEPERIDEDAGADVSNDKLPGIAGIDDNGDGSIDISAAAIPGNDDDEDDVADEDKRDGSDTDGDGAVDEDWAADVEADGQAGLAGVDDDLDLNTDEGDPQDDDEDGNKDEDWLDPVVFFLVGDTLIERVPNLNPVDGNDYSEYAIAEHVSYFRVERIAATGKRTVLVDITLGLSMPDAEPIQLTTRVRVGGGR